MELHSLDDTKPSEHTKPQIIREKTTEILAPSGGVFYNPVQEYNRDFSVLALQIFSKKFHEQNANGNMEEKKPFRILEALSASGLRSIRYAKEIPNVTEVIANDNSSAAVENIKNNIRHNNVENIVKPSNLDAAELMFINRHPKNRFEAVDIDPYGSPSQFLDSAVQCVADGGILLVTCTDTNVLCGNYPETCYVKYGAVSLKSQSKCEMCLRIILQSIQSHASKYKRYIVPLLSLKVDFYVRIFVKVHTKPVLCKQIFSNLSMVYHCCSCFSTVLLPLGCYKTNEKEDFVQYFVPKISGEVGTCVYCGGKQQMGGPIWNGPIHDQSFVKELIESEEINEFGTSKRLLGMLTMVYEELQDVPLYYGPAVFCKVLKSVPIPLITFRSAIMNGGYRSSLTHTDKNALKTDAPLSFLWDLFKEWSLKNSKSEPKTHNKNILPESPAANILKHPIKHNIDFTIREDANPTSRKKGLLRFQMNPAPHWGPGTKSTRKVLENLEEELPKKRSKN